MLPGKPLHSFVRHAISYDVSRRPLTIYISVALHVVFQSNALFDDFRVSSTIPIVFYLRKFLQFWKLKIMAVNLS